MPHSGLQNRTLMFRLTRLTTLNKNRYHIVAKIRMPHAISIKKISNTTKLTLLYLYTSVLL